jgi:hypothetical protein
MSGLGVLQVEEWALESESQQGRKFVDGRSCPNQNNGGCRVTELTTEQEFALIQFQVKVSQINDLATAKVLLIDLYQQMILKDNYYKAALMQRWGI